MRFAIALSLLLPAAVACATSAGSSTPSPTTTDLLARPDEGFLELGHGRVWYRIAGRGEGTPLVVLHGGPGIPHDYLANLEALGVDRPVVFYDQLGCGRSDRPGDPALWTVDFFVRELAAVREALELDLVFLYGHSWGSILAVESLLSAPAAARGVRGLILAGPALSIPRWIEDTRALVHELPADAVAAIETAEREERFDTPAYQAAVELFYQRHVCRADPWPEPLVHALETMGTEVYETMWGPSEFTARGTLRDLDLTPRLGELALPVLFVCGEYDEAPPATTRAYARLVPDSEVAVITGAAHVANYDRPEETIRVLADWLRRHDP